jgi:hypothetical protein
VLEVAGAFHRIRFALTQRPRAAVRPAADDRRSRRSWRARAPGEWSRCVCVTTIAPTLSPCAAASRCARWVPSAGPGSMTATSPRPTM